MTGQANRARERQHSSSVSRVIASKKRGKRAEGFLPCNFEMEARLLSCRFNILGDPYSFSRTSLSFLSSHCGKAASFLPSSPRSRRSTWRTSYHYKRVTKGPPGDHRSGLFLPKHPLWHTVFSPFGLFVGSVYSLLRLIKSHLTVFLLSKVLDTPLSFWSSASLPWPIQPVLLLSY